ESTEKVIKVENAITVKIAEAMDVIRSRLTPTRWKKRKLDKKVNEILTLAGKNTSKWIKEE
ncbi:MAG: hypothetical protein Q8R15_02795, partial [Candidatus Micrarchaeota archaeon]|nr:hypothetical protein [Candidatus Micrarchaeota archaeon]